MKYKYKEKKLKVYVITYGSKITRSPQGDTAPLKFQKGSAPGKSTT